MSLAFDELYVRYRTRMYALAYRLTGNRDDAEDLTQESFARAWRSFQTLRDHANFFAWLRAIMLNAFKDWLQTRKKPIPAPSEPEDPAETAVRFEERLLLKAIINSMEERERVVLDLSHLQGLSNEEIARVLGVDTDHVRVILHRARQKLAERLREKFR